MTVTTPQKASQSPPKPRRRHGLGKVGIDTIVAQQGGGCAICGVPYADKPGHRLAVDHDHRHCPGKTGCPVCIRGMLCHACNNILRLVKDDAELLRKAIGYLDAHNRLLW